MHVDCGQALGDLSWFEMRILLNIEAAVDHAAVLACTAESQFQGIWKSPNASSDLKQQTAFSLVSAVSSQTAAAAIFLLTVIHVTSNLH